MVTLNRLVLSFLFSVFCILPVVVFSASKNDGQVSKRGGAAAPDDFTNTSPIDAIATVEPATETVTKPDKAESEVPAVTESGDSTAETVPVETTVENSVSATDKAVVAPAAETIPEEEIPTVTEPEESIAETIPKAAVEKPAVNASEVAPAAVVSDTESPLTSPASESHPESPPAAGIDKAVVVPAVEETSMPGGESVETEKTGELAPAVIDGVDENAGVATVGITDPSPESTVAAENPLKAEKLELFAGISLMKFDYTEFDTNGAWLDDEIGVLPGLLLGGTLYWTHYYASVEFNYFSSEVDYRGQTQSKDPALSGLPINSRSDADIIDIKAIAGYQFSSLNLYGGLGYYYWRRNIQPTTTDSGLQVAGVLEFYSWTYALVGLNTPLFNKEDSQFSLDIRATRMLQAEMEVDFLGFQGYDNVNLNLGEDWGLRLALPWSFALSTIPHARITVEPYYVTWNIKRSATSELTVGGVGTGSGVVEPGSETRNFGVSLYFQYSM